MRFYLREFLLSLNFVARTLSSLLSHSCSSNECIKENVQNVPKYDSVGEKFYSLTYVTRSLSFHSLWQLLCEWAHKGKRAKRTKKRREFENIACHTQLKIVEFLNAINQFNSSIKIGPRSHLDRISHVYLPLFCFLLDPTNPWTTLKRPLQSITHTVALIWQTLTLTLTDTQTHNGNARYVNVKREGLKL